MKWPRSFRNSKSYFIQIISPVCIQCYGIFVDHLCDYSYRGYYSRKYEHDFYARKTYLNHVQTKNEEVRKKLTEYQRQVAFEE